MAIDWDDVAHTVELRGVYDGWSVLVMKDGRRINRWVDSETGQPHPGYERRAAVIDAYLRGEESNGRWF